MWKDGASASIIGDELGITRNAVIGKVHRLGLEARLPTFKHTSRIAPIGRPISKPPQRIVSVMTVTVSKSKSKPELTKGELRRLFEEAWRNTATMEKRNETV
jgi:GcrA cell cycle regulator